MAIEKRKERRIKVSLPIKIIYKNNIKILGNTENISRLGAYVEVDKEIPAGMDVDINLEIPAYTEDLSLTGAVRCKGNIFRCNLTKESEPKKYYGIGVFFTNFLKQIDRDKLSRYIDFLILQEEKGVREGIRRLRDKRDKTQKTKQSSKIQLKQEDYQREALNLLEQILSRSEETLRLLQSHNKTR
jgi:hypothetical protein